MIDGYKISVVVPTYNEEKTIGAVLKSLTSFNLIDQVVCVDDGSKDGSYNEIKKYKNKVAVIHYDQNRGKGYALYRGVLLTNGDIVIFFDSDNVEIVEEDFIVLVKTLLNNKYRMVLGNPRGVHQGGRYDSITGERVFFRSDIVKIAENFKDCGLGVEIYINFVFKKWINIPLKCRHLEKPEKYNFIPMLWNYARQGSQMVYVWIKIAGIKLRRDYFGLSS